jgi:cytochrome P450
MVERVRSETGAVELPTVRTSPLDPPTELAPLRERGGVSRLRYPNGEIGWLVTSYSLGRAVLSDSRFRMRFEQWPVGDPRTIAALANDNEGRPTRPGNLLTQDPPEHTRIRKPQAEFVTARALQAYRGEIVRIVSERLDVMESEGPPVDLAETFSDPVSSMVICAMLGVPADDRRQFEAPVTISQDPFASAAEKIASFDEFEAYLRRVIADKRAHPADDLMSKLAAKEALTDAEFSGAIGFLFAAGFHTSSGQLTLSVLALLVEPTRWEWLRRARGAEVLRAIEELLRYLSIAHCSLTRTAACDIDLGNVRIRAGESVTVSLSAANRDPNKFENPDTLDLCRPKSGHLAFGHGRHICLAQHLVRLELAVALPALAQRFPTLRLAVPIHEIPMADGVKQVYTAERLPVTW